ncbi:MAG: hypothetical protein M1820_007044 [Bogoriella megaspora]|nr:MAG: hypothetical protein M1820_007044 [Bogoriella megaspora]
MQPLRTSILTLARELREIIYEHTLISKSPIVAWAGEWKADAPIQPFEQRWRWVPGQRPGEPHCPVRCSREVDKEATKQSLQQLAFNTLQSSSLLAEEAASVFYRKNTFKFLGDHNWDPIVAWLKGIGRRNRGYLRNIEIEVRRPDRVWQHEDGRRVCCLYTREEVYPRNKWLGFETGSDQEGVVDNINPAVEEVFALLQDRDALDKTTITFNTSSGVVPGIFYGYDAEDPGSTPMSMDLPNLVETFRRIYSKHSSEGPATDVLWKGEIEKEEFDKTLDDMPHEWEILNAASYNCKVRPPFNYDNQYSEAVVRWTAKRASLGTATSQAITPSTSKDYIGTESNLASKPNADDPLEGPEGPLGWALEWRPDEMWALEPAKKDEYVFVSAHPIMQKTMNE